MNKERDRSIAFSRLRSALEGEKMRIDHDILPALRLLEIPDPDLILALDRAVIELDRHLNSFILEYNQTGNTT